MIEKCQVFTPPDIALSMLDLAGYTSNIFNKKFLENASGDGVIFLAAVERYISSALLEGYNLKEIKLGLEKNLHAYEIDSIHIEKCIKAADEIASSFGIYDVKWTINKQDFLKAKINVKYDFVVGNPPYIKYNEIPTEERNFIISTFETCRTGKPDYCYPFIEKSVDSLSSNGVLVYLIPSSIFKNEFANEIRERIKRGLTHIKNYTSMKLFPVLTQSAIIKVINYNFINTIVYQDVVDNRILEISKEQLKNKWIFDNDYQNDGMEKFGDFFTASSSIATLYNNAFLLEKCDLSGSHVTVKGCDIEVSVIKKAASLKSFLYQKDKYIIFPYRFDSNGNLEKYSDEDFQEMFPGCYKYLKKYEERLGKRKSDKSAKWFEYGRSQAIQKMKYPKLLVSKIFSNSIKVYSIDEETIPYSGNIVIQNSEVSLDIAKLILKSNQFLEYAIQIGAHASGKSHQISAKDINNFRFNMEDFI